MDTMITDIQGHLAAVGGHASRARWSATDATSAARHRAHLVVSNPVSATYEVNKPSIHGFTRRLTEGSS